MTAIAACTSSPLMGADNEIRLIPAGLFSATDGRPVGLSGWNLTPANATKIIRESALKKNDFVIDYEHQTLLTADNGQPAPAAGWFRRLEWREGVGLFAVDVRWTDRAAAMVKAHEYRYLSPVFGFDKKTGEINSLHSAAITNSPALDGLTDLMAATCINSIKYESRLLDEPEFATPRGFTVNQKALKVHYAALRYQRTHGGDYLQAVLKISR